MRDLVELVSSAAAQEVHVPGTPLTLRLDGVEEATGACRMSWSYADPTDRARGNRIRGETTVDISDLPDEEVGELCWDASQLAAAHRWKYELDGDEMPGVPYTGRTWTAHEAWQALLVLLRRFGTPNETGDGEITVEDGDASHVLRLDPAKWAAYVSLPEQLTREDIVPTAVLMVDDLPFWVWDEMFEALGSGGPVVGLVDGQLRPLPDQ